MSWWCRLASTRLQVRRSWELPLPAQSTQSKVQRCFRAGCSGRGSLVSAIGRASLQIVTAVPETAAREGTPSTATVVALPAATHTRVKTAAYVSSSVKLSQCPKPQWPEFAVIGRSNVGKSSLINLLTGQKALAQVSKTPGKTRCINHFLINDSWYLVDLPGYGYAATAKFRRLEWSDFTKDYFLNRQSLASVLLLVDASVEVQAADLECATWLADAQVPFCLVFTKIDKRKKRCSSPSQNIASFQEAFLKTYEQLPACLQTSADRDIGRQDVLAHIAQLRALYNSKDTADSKP